MKEMPETVKALEVFFNKKKLWHHLTQNPKAESCADAANKRSRLGHQGIPIFDELKSNFGTFINKDGQISYAMLHCRGNQKLITIR